MANVHYVIKVIEPNKEYLKEFIDPKLENCKRDAQEYLWNCPRDTKYIYVATKIRKERYEDDRILKQRK